MDPFHNKASIKGRKNKRNQGSSHYRQRGFSELQALPQLKGFVIPKLIFFKLKKNMILYFYCYFIY